MNPFDLRLATSTEHYFVSPTVRVAMQTTRADSVYTYVEDLVSGGGVAPRWRIRHGSVQGHGRHDGGEWDKPRFRGIARARVLWGELRAVELDRARAEETGLDIAALRHIAKEELSAEPSS